jgi:hypothetical protein
MGRTSLWFRSKLQGKTPVEALTPQEQAWVTTHENLRQMLIEAQMGLGPFRSTGMMTQLEDTIGRYWTPGTGPRLQALADALRSEQGGIATAEVAGRRLPVHTPPPVTNQNQNLPQTKGERWKVRELSTGRIRPWDPQGATQPPAGYVRVE